MITSEFAVTYVLTVMYDIFLCHFINIGLRPNIYEPPRDKTNKVTVRPAKTKISLSIRPVQSESSLCA